MFLYIAQIGWILFAILCGPEEGAWSWPYRNLNTSQFDSVSKYRWSRVAHKMGWLSVAMLGIVYAALMTITLGTFKLWTYLLILACLAIEYWVFFDASYAKSIGKDIFYIGTTSSVDRFFGTKSGKIKFFAGLILIAGINVIIKIL
jgi:phosphoglycerol transferase MdoB-like AlkP superfamily enzyme